MTPFAINWVLTWLWQGCLITAGVAAMLHVTKRTSAATRFLALWTTLAAVLLVALVPVVASIGSATPDVPTASSRDLGHTGSSETAGTSVETTTLLPIAIPSAPGWLGLSLAAAWIGWVALRLSAVLWSLRRLRELKRITTPLPADVEAKLPLWLAVRSRGRRTQLRTSSRVATAAMLGLGSPVIVLPERLLDSLSLADVDQVVMHEYGHVQRYDDWGILGQAVVQALFGWHPAVCWISRQLHLEREVASDDWVARHTSAPREYASCLARVAELALIHRTVPYAASAVRSRRELSGRVERLLDPERNLTLRPARPAIAAEILTLACVVFLLAMAPPMVDTIANGMLAPVPSPPVSRQALSVPEPELRGAAVASIPAQAAASDSILGVPETVPRAALRSVALALDWTASPPRPSTEVQPPLQSNDLALAFEITRPRLATPQGLRSQVAVSKPDDTAEGPWIQVANVGKAVGFGAAEAGQATAAAFQVLGSRVTRVFGGN